MYFMLCKTIILKSFFGYPKIYKLQLWLSKDVGAKKLQDLSPSNGKVELESSGSGSKKIFGAERLQL